MTNIHLAAELEEQAVLLRDRIGNSTPDLMLRAALALRALEHRPVEIMSRTNFVGKQPECTVMDIPLHET